MRNVQPITASGGLRERQKQKEKKQKSSNPARSAPTFGLPYDKIWPSMPKIHIEMVREEVERTFDKTVCDQWLLQKKRKLEKRELFSYVQIQEILLQLMEKNTIYNKTDRQQRLCTLGDKNRVQSLNEYLVTGINNVTRCLEKNETFSLVMVCRSAQPVLITQQVMCRCLLSNVPACAMEKLSETLAPILNFKSLLAIAFKNIEKTPFSDLVEFIKDKIPIQNTDWVRSWNLSPVISNEKSETTIDILKIGSKRPETDRCVNDNVNFCELDIVWKLLQPKKNKEQKKTTEEK